MLVGEGIQLDQLLVGNDVAGWVRRTGDADHTGLLANVQMLKVDVILKLAARQQFNIRTGRDKEILFQP